MNLIFGFCLVAMLFIVSPDSCKSDILVEYSFADSNPSTATNTGSLGAAADGVITGGSIIASPLSSDGLGLLLDGMNGSGISMPNVFDYGDELTVEALVRLDSLNGQNSNIIFDDFGGPGVLLSVNSDGFLRFTVFTSNGDATAISNSVFPLATWHHVAGVYDGNDVRLFIDEQLVSSVSATGSVLSNPNVIPHVGVESSGSVFPWNGAIDDFRIHDRAISIPIAVCATDGMLVEGFGETGDFNATCGSDDLHWAAHGSSLFYQIADPVVQFELFATAPAGSGGSSITVDIEASKQSDNANLNLRALLFNFTTGNYVSLPGIMPLATTDQLQTFELPVGSDPNDFIEPGGNEVRLLLQTIQTSGLPNVRTRLDDVLFVFE